jgi:hypothetical protein
METKMSAVAKKILSHSAELPEGAVLSAKLLLQFGERAAVDQALSRLHRQGLLYRVARGTYVRPVEGKFGTRPPAPEKVVEAMAIATGETVASNGAAAANALGLTTQVPARAVYVTAGASRVLHLGKQSVEFRHAPHWQLAMASRPAGAAIRALAWLGEAQAPRALEQLRLTLPHPEWRALSEVRRTLPIWMAKAVSEAMPNA